MAINCFQPTTAGVAAHLGLGTHLIRSRSTPPKSTPKTVASFPPNKVTLSLGMVSFYRLASA
jgi:hypothetical protein